MRTLFGLHSAALLTGFALFGCAPLRPVDEVEPRVTAAHSALLAAFNTCNEAAFISAYAADFTFTTSNTAAAYTTIPAIKGYLAAACRQSPSPQVTLKSQTLRHIDSMAFLTGQYVFRLASTAGTREIIQNYTVALRLENDAWRITAHHVSLAP